MKVQMLIAKKCPGWVIIIKLVWSVFFNGLFDRESACGFYDFDVKEEGLDSGLLGRMKIENTWCLGAVLAVAWDREE